MKRILGKALIVALLTAGCGFPLTPGTAFSQTSAGSDAIVLQWNELAVQVVGATPPFPSTRAMATVQLAVFEAVNAITHRYRPYFGTVGASGGASVDAAVVAAAHDTLVWLFPAQQSLLDARQAESLAGIASGTAKDDGIAVGRTAAAAMIANRTNDGAQTPLFHTPVSTTPYEWQPTPSCASAPANNRGVFLHWQFVKPFGVESSSQFRVEPPPQIGSGKYAKDFDEVVAVGAADSTLRTAHEADVARFYAAQPPHRGWNLVARQLARARSDEITRTARTLAMLNMSLSDGHVTVFESKYHYRTWRPETGIARAAEDGNQRTDPVTHFRPYIAAPCFPGYPSAHAAGGGVGRTILARAYGRKHHDLTMVDGAIENVALRYTDLKDIAADVTIARVYGGIHFRVDQDLGERMGTLIARYNDDHWLQPIGSVPPSAPDDE